MILKWLPLSSWLLPTISCASAYHSAEDFAAPYSAALEPEAHDRCTGYLRTASHAYHHVGRTIYLSKEVTKPAP